MLCKNKEATMTKSERQMVKFQREMEEAEDKENVINILRNDYSYGDDDDTNSIQLEDMSLKELNKLLDDIESGVEDFMYPNGHDNGAERVNDTRLMTVKELYETAVDNGAERVNMTVKELYEKAVDNGAENFNIELQNQDSGGTYEGTTTMEDFDINEDAEEITLW